MNRVRDLINDIKETRENVREEIRFIKENNLAMGKSFYISSDKVKELYSETNKKLFSIEKKMYDLEEKIDITSRELVGVRTSSFKRGYIVFNSKINKYGYIQHYNVNTDDSTSFSVFVLIKEKDDLFVFEKYDGDKNDNSGIRTSTWREERCEIIAGPEQFPGQSKNPLIIYNPNKGILERKAKTVESSIDLKILNVKSYRNKERFGMHPKLINHLKSCNKKLKSRKDKYPKIKGNDNWLSSSVCKLYLHFNEEIEELDVEIKNILEKIDNKKTISKNDRARLESECCDVTNMVMILKDKIESMIEDKKDKIESMIEDKIDKMESMIEDKVDKNEFF